MKEYIKKRWLENSLLIFFIIVGGATKVLAAYSSGFSFNELIKYNKDGFINYILLSLLFFGIYLLSLQIKIPYENYVIQKMLIDIKKDLSVSITKNDYESFNKNNSGSYVSWLSNDLMLIEERGFNNFYKILTLLIETSLAIIGLLSFHWSIIVFSIVMSFITLALPSIVQNKIQEKALTYSESFENFISKSTNSISGFDTLLSFNKLDVIKNKILVASDKILKNSVSLRKIVAFSAVLGGIGNTLSQVGVLILTGILILANIVSFGAIITVEALTSTIFNSVGNIMTTKIELSTVKPIFEKFNNFKKASLKIFEENNSKSSIDCLINKISIEDLKYKYENNSEISYKNITFKKNNKYLIIGKSGSGKSTLFKLLTGRLTNYTGNIKINNQNIKDLKIENLYNQMIYISQEPYIFTDTIKFNVTLGEFFSEEEIINTFKKVGLYDFVKNLKDGINTELIENGKNLSGGQKQRLCLARGLIRNKNIVLLDEVTSNQDEENTENIENFLLENNKLMVIMISHKIDNKFKEKFDEIINLD